MPYLDCYNVMINLSSDLKLLFLEVWGILKLYLRQVISAGIMDLQENLAKRLEEGNMVEVMTDKQFDGILQMIEMIVDSCRDLDEAKKKIAELRSGKKEKEES